MRSFKMKLLLTLTGLVVMLIAANTQAIELLAMTKDCAGDCAVKARVINEGGEAVEETTNSREIAQAVLCEPKGNLDVDARVASLLCKYASRKYDQISSMYSSLDNISPFESVLLASSGLHESAYRLNQKAIEDKKSGSKTTVEVPKEWFRIAGEWWDQIGHKIYCTNETMDDVAFDGYLNFHLLKTGQTNTLYNLYDTNGDYEADINKTVPLRPCDENSPDATFIDIIDDSLENPVGQMNDSNSIMERFKTMRSIFVKPSFGAKKAIEVIPNRTSSASIN